LRKINPNDVRADFDSKTLNVRDFHEKLDASLDVMSDKSTLAEATLLRLAVLWEGFLSDLFVAYINRNSSKFSEHLEISLESQLQGKGGRIYNQFGTLNIPTHLTKDDIYEILDADGFNITFRSASEIRDKATKWLVEDDRNRVHSLAAQDDALINALYGLRNHLAHGSEGSSDRMNAALAAGALHHTGFQRRAKKISNVGSYLKSIQAGESRLVQFIANIRAIAGNM
jgi:hypothetical protein